MTRDTRYWIIVASKDHVKTGVSDGIAQTCHGKASPLKRMRKGDFIIYYSGKQTQAGGEVCQEFTAIGKVMDEEIYEFRVSDEFRPFRRNIEFLPSREVSILPLIPELTFILNKKSWGNPLRYGFLEIQQQDFKRISSQMLQKDYVSTH